jgi:seryl-tRNA synthetase
MTHVNAHLTITMITVPFDNIPGDVFRFLGEDGLRLMAQLINNIYTTEQWQKGFKEVTMTTLKGKHKATKCIKYHTVTPTTHAAKSLKSLIWDECN